MVEVTRLDGKVYYVNPHQIEYVERNPDTTLITIVPPTVEEVAPVEGVLALYRLERQMATRRQGIALACLGHVEGLGRRREASRLIEQLAAQQEHQHDAQFHDHHDPVGLFLLVELVQFVEGLEADLLVLKLE
jgi:hypothetical protein